MDVLGPLVGLAGFLALIAGGIMFLPIASFRSRRSLAKKLLIGGGVGFVLGMILSPTPPKVAEPTPSPAPTASAGPQSVAAPAAPTPTPSPSPAADPAAPRAAFVALYRDFLGRAKPCDGAVGKLGEAANGGSTFATYQAAKDGRAACAETIKAIDALTAPEGLPTKGATGLAKAREACGNAYRLKERAMEKSMQIADGEGRPSLVSSTVDDLKNAQTGVLLCVAQWFDAASGSGVDFKELR